MTQWQNYLQMPMQTTLLKKAEPNQHYDYPHYC